MKADGKFSFTFNGEHWVWVDFLNKYESHGHQPQGRKNNNNNNNRRPKDNGQQHGENCGGRSGGGLIAIALAA
jgi:hypothetical protein